MIWLKLILALRTFGVGENLVLGRVTFCTKEWISVEDPFRWIKMLNTQSNVRNFKSACLTQYQDKIHVIRNNALIIERTVRHWTYLAGIFRVYKSVKEIWDHNKHCLYTNKHNRSRNGSYDNTGFKGSNTSRTRILRHQKPILRTVYVPKLKISWILLSHYFRFL